MTMSGLSEMDGNVVQVDAKEFTDIEKQLILQVVARDEDIRIQENSRLDKLKEELRNLKEMGVPDESLDVSYGSACKRCRTPLGFIFNSGAFCPNCDQKVCKDCRIPLEVNTTWNCTLCSKYRDMQAESGAWFYSSGPEEQTVKEQKKVYGSILMKSVFSVVRKQDYFIYKDPEWTDIVQDADPVEEIEDELDDYLLITEGDHQFREVPISEVRGVKTNGRVAFGEEVEEGVEATCDTFEEACTDSASIISDHSEDGDVGPFSMLAGEIQIGLKYDYNTSVFEVQIHRAKDLHPADWNTFIANPYVKVYLSSAVQTYGKKKTKAHKNTLNPEFDEVISFDINHEELVTCTCSVQIWHYEFSNKNISLGEVDINVEEFLSSGFTLDIPIPQWYTLYTRRRDMTQVNFCGELIIGLQYEAPGSLVADSKREQRKLPNPTKGKFLVNLIQAKGLDRGEDTFYCQLSLVLSNKNTLKMKSDYVTATDPYWDEQFTISNISWLELETSYFQVSLRAKQNDSSVFVAGTRLGLGMGAHHKHDSFGEEVRVWKSMLDHTNDPQDFCIPLRNSLDSVKQEHMAVPLKQVKEIPDKEYDRLKNKRHSLSSLSLRRFSDSALSIASSGSMLSVYSNAGGQTKNLVITGEILFSIKHDDNSNVFSVRIEKAKGLAAVNVQQQTSHPYCKLYLLPDKTKSTKKKIRHRRRTINPQWSETVKYNISREELKRKTLQVSILNRDKFGRNDFLGEVQVNISHYASMNNLETELPVWYTLQEAAPVSVGGARDNIGEIKIRILFDHEVLNVHVIQANGLYAVNPEKLPNPFVKCYLLPDKSRKGKRKTYVQKETIAPVWDEKFSFKGVEVDDLYSRVLEVTVWDYNTSGHQFLGGIRLGLEHGDEYWHDCFGKEVTIWELMMKHLGILAEYAIPLRTTMTSRKGQTIQEYPTMTPIQEEPEPIASVTDHLLGLPIIRVSLQYLESDEVHDSKKKKSPKGSLKVHLWEAKNLPALYVEDAPSSFCKAFLRNKKKKGFKYLTGTYMKSVDPVWNTEMVFEGVTLDTLRYRGLEIGVYDDISEKRKNLIGLVRLGSGGYVEDWDDSSGIEIEIWRSMLNNPSDVITLNVPLRITDAYLPEDEEFDEEEDILSFEEVDEEDAEPETRSESPRSAALRAMGVHDAINVVSMINETEDRRNVGLITSNVGLTPIEEKDEISSAMIVLQPPKEVAKVVKPGEPPFRGAGIEIEDEIEMFNSKSNAKTGRKHGLRKKSFSEESVSSDCSTDNINLYGQIPVRGDIQLGMKYDFTTDNFELHVFQAKGIASVDTKKETADTYCKVYLLPDKSKSGKRKTGVRRRTLNPEWEEILHFKVSLRDLRTRILWVALWGLERLGPKVFLGEVLINMDLIIDRRVDLEVSIPTWYPLCEKSKPPVSDLFKGEISFGIMFQDNTMISRGTQKRGASDKDEKKKKPAATGKIKVHIRECESLPAADRNGFSDPFCKCYLLPLKDSKTKRKTPVILHTMNPKWDYKFEYEVDYEELADHGIEFSVWDWDRGVPNDFLGCSRINLGSRVDKWNDGYGIEVECWQHLIDHPNTWKEFTIPLRSKRVSRHKHCR